MKTHRCTRPRNPLILAALLFTTVLTSLLSAQTTGNSIVLQNGVGGYMGTQDFYTYQMDGGVFNSKTDLDEQSLRVAPLEFDTKSVMRFTAIPLSRGNFSSVSRLALVLTFKSPPQADTIMLHALNSSDIWVERDANYNTLNGTAPWSGADGKLIDAWSNTDGTANVTGSESVHSQLVIEFHPHDANARRALLESWLGHSNTGFVIRGINGANEFYSSDAYNFTHRPELIIEVFR